jgi:predicted nucleic acid-binding protein
VNWIPVYRAAAKWAALHSPRIGCRSLDVLHVSLAKHLNASEFVTFDERQKSLAMALRFLLGTSASRGGVRGSAQEAAEARR